VWRIILRFITKRFVRFSSVALIAVAVQVSLISLTSAPSAEPRYKRAPAINEKALGSSLSDTQIEGTYEGTFTTNQVTGEHQISLTLQQ
jgi:hypothetical protein